MPLHTIHGPLAPSAALAAVGAVEYLDADTVLIDIQASGVDVHTFATIVRYVPPPMLIPSVPVQDRSRW